jgi:hypothetical protein
MAGEGSNCGVYALFKGVHDGRAIERRAGKSGRYSLVESCNRPLDVLGLPVDDPADDVDVFVAELVRE